MLNHLKQQWVRYCPQFLLKKPNEHLASFYRFSNYPYLWGMSIFILAAAALTPLWFTTLIHYNLIQRSVDSELALRAERLTSNAKRSMAFFLEERLDALTFTINEMGYDVLVISKNLEEILKNLKLGFGGVSDLSLIDVNGNQIAYAGPFNLEGKNYKRQPWFEQCIQNPAFISDVFTGYRNEPHINIAVRAVSPDGSFYILKAALDTHRLIKLLEASRPNIHTDIFLINRAGILQTPSPRYGEIFKPIPFPVPPYSPKTSVMHTPEDTTGTNAYSYISTQAADTPFILIVHKKKAGVMERWLDIGRNFNWIVGISGCVIILIITIGATFMVSKIYMVEKHRAEAMLKMEQNQQLASIGQLAAGVAHEINNPLALINETAGYMKDLYTFEKENIDQEEALEHIDAILDSVDRCGTITKQLLGFVRQFDVRTRDVHLDKMISEVLNFHKKEAEYRGISVSKIFPENLPVLHTDSGKLQQILVNLINNAFQAVDTDGCLDVLVSLPEPERVQIVIRDTGCGISEENLKKIHEPFFSTKKEKMGTGLGLSITYGLVKKLGGIIQVESAEGVGTIFTITLPIRTEKGDSA